MNLCIRHTLILSTLILAGCLSTRYGVDKETWEGLTEAQKTATISSYNRRKELKAEQRLLETEQRLLEAKEAQDRMLQETATAIENAPKIRILISRGFLSHKGTVYPIKRTEMTLKHGSAATLKLERAKETGTLLEIPLSYQRGRFIFGKDERTSFRKSSIQFLYEEDWKRGKRYSFQKMPVHSGFDGRISLEIKAIPSRENDDLLRLVIEELID